MHISYTVKYMLSKKRRERVIPLSNGGCGAKTSINGDSLGIPHHYRGRTVVVLIGFFFGVKIPKEGDRENSIWHNEK